MKGLKMITRIKSYIERKHWRVRETNPSGWTGGPNRDFEKAGRLQLITLLRCGLEPCHTVLDVGCGCLRGGYWILHFLNDGNYYGIEPDKELLKNGFNFCGARKGIYSTNETFDFTVFEREFDYVLARSIWTHASKGQIKTMLDSFKEVAKTESVFLTSYIRPGLFKRDYKGIEWHGRSHKSNVRGCIAHSYRWIKKACAERELTVKELPFCVLNNQRWLYITQKSSKREYE